MAKILVLFSNQKTDLDISHFSSRNSRCRFHIFLSLLDLTFWHLVNACRNDTLSYLLITMIKCLKGHNSLESLYDEGLLKSICHCHCVCFCLFVGWFISLHYSERSQVSLFEGDQLGEPSNRTIGKIWSFVPTRSQDLFVLMAW